jgi:formylglycine-generating enzyme required for sulfatase activity
MIDGVAADRYLDVDLAKGRIEPVRYAAGHILRPTTSAESHPVDDGSETFTWLREETFSCGGQIHTVAIYRCEPLARALRLAPGESDVVCEFVLVPSGSFVMGSSPEEQKVMADSRVNRHPVLNSRIYPRDREGPQHQVTVPPFLMARTEVTQALWRRLAIAAGLPESPSFFKHAGDRAPVERVSWNDVTKWMKAVNAAPGLFLRLPSEAEWEYACRAGTTTAIYNGPLTILGHCNGPELDEIGWYMGNCGVNYSGGVDSSRWIETQFPHDRAGTHPVALKQPNAFGLYDMIGNVMEWCEDHAHADYRGAPTDGSAWIGGDWIPGSALNGPMTAYRPKDGIADGRDVPGRVRRGGSWRQLAYNTRSAMRSFRSPNFIDSNHGFRLASDVPPDLLQGD